MKQSEQIAQHLKEAKEHDFRELMSQPHMKLMISLIPPSQPPELVETLVKTMFDKGFDSGVGTVVLHMTDEVLRKIQGGES